MYDSDRIDSGAKSLEMKRKTTIFDPDSFSNSFLFPLFRPEEEIICLLACIAGLGIWYQGVIYVRSTPYKTLRW